MSSQITHILALTDALEAHTGKTHWAISMPVFGKGDKIQLLKQGRDLTTGMAELALGRLSYIWPEDLEWPDDIPRPDPIDPAPRKVAS